MTWVFDFGNFISSVTAMIILSAGIQDILINIGENKCGMTWMYEPPEYIKVELPVTIQERYSRYSLYIYGEGYYADYLKSWDGNLKLDGIPVVFVHGNAGRYKQVRSLASVSLRKSERSEYHFNYFTIDFQEELSALYGPYLNQQTEYLSHCLVRILQCYSHLRERPTSVIAIGHSMGGIIIRGLFSLQGFNTNMINTIINLATPQTKPVLSIDPELYSYYQSVNSDWFYNTKIFENISIISLGGGVRDYLVPSSLCAIKDNFMNHHVNLITTNIPLVWRSTDHQCIVWCNELVRLETRMFFHMIDESTGFISKNHTFRKNVIDTFLKTANHFQISSKPTIDCSVLHINETRIKLTTDRRKCHLLSINNLDDQKYFVSILIEDKVENWAFLCEDSYTCQTIISTELIPSSKIGVAQSFLRTNITKGKMIMMKFSKQVRINIQQDDDLIDLIDFPYFFRKKFHNTHNRFYLEFSCPFFTETWQVYDMTVYFDKKLCETIIGNLISSGSSESEYFKIINPGETFQLRLFHQKSSTLSPVKLRFYGDNLKDLEFSLKFNIISSIGQIIRLQLEVLLKSVLLFGLLHTFWYIYMKFYYKQIISHTYFKKLLFLIFLKLILLFFIVDKTVSYGWKDMFPQVFVSILAFFLTKVLRSILKIAATIIITALTPALFAMETIFQPLRFSIKCVGVQVRWYHLILILAVISAFFIESINLNILLMLLLLVNFLRVQRMNDNMSKKFHFEVFLGVFPVIFIFNIVPVIIYIKDYANGSNGSAPTFWNIQLLITGYIIYLFTDFETYCNLTEAFQGKWNLVVAGFHLFFYILMFIPFMPLFLVTCLCFFQLSFIVICW